MQINKKLLIILSALPLFNYAQIEMLSTEIKELEEVADIKEALFQAQLPKLIVAAVGNDLNAVQQLISNQQVDINQQDEFGETALYKAVTNRNVPIVEFLMNNGADPNIINNNGYTALYLAAQNGSNDMIRLLLKTGPGIKTADINYQIKPPFGQGWTPLHAAIIRDLPDTVDLLLSLGADPYLKTFNDLDAMQFAQMYGKESIVDIIERYVF